MISLVRLFFFASAFSHFWLNSKMLTPWKESYDQPRQHIQKQKHYFANKGPTRQGYGFSSGHVWMWVWVNSGSWWWKGRPGVLRLMGSQRVRHDWGTELNRTDEINECNNVTLDMEETTRGNILLGQEASKTGMVLRLLLLARSGLVTHTMACQWNLH